MGNFNQLITFSIPTINTVNTYGEPVLSNWVEDFKTGANIRLMSSRETINSSRETDDDWFMFEVRLTTKSNTVNDSHRIATADGDLFDILSVDKYTLKHKRLILIKARRSS